MFRRIEESRSFARRWLALGAVGAFLLGSLGCSGSDDSQRNGGATTRQAKENRKVAENSALEGVVVAANSQAAAHSELKKQNRFEQFVANNVPTFTVTTSTPPAAPNPPAAPAVAARPESPVRRATRESSPVVISERIVTEIPYPTEAEADARAIEEAQKLIEKRLKELDPPVEYLPPISEVRNEYIRKESRLVRLPPESEKIAIASAGYVESRRYVDYTVEITGEQIRELRTRSRVTDGLRALGAIAAVSLAGFFFLRLDEWSKGYLTSWLALAAAALGGGIVAALVFV